MGSSVLTRSELRAMIENEESVRSMVNHVMVVGRDVRSTPMQMSYEGKKLTCAVKHLSWKPPWVQDVDGEPDETEEYLGENSTVPDLVPLAFHYAAMLEFTVFVQCCAKRYAQKRICPEFAAAKIVKRDSPNQCWWCSESR